ncbi:hypothetical protein HYPSUDRAFT_57765 [Hypholoma sublateritium FD-334 SS-4]|uniref:Uncharacterized protein n=1 Tax=Hypholoma sublateritium (strain FD-334 SS-4) TaxID=945553 RepID=A0A0D2NL47_HYPSF|nr:hypothetical protein HYPSUDRAFT_57765 [Hypholoma sublateritium FD-334 SS-4]
MENLDKTLFDGQCIRFKEFDPSSDTAESWLNECVNHYVEQGLIPLELKELVPDSPANQFDQFYGRILHSVAWSLQYPKMKDPHGNRDPVFLLGCFIDAHMVTRGHRRGRGSPFFSFCIVYTDIPGIPDHYGHSAWRNKVPRRPTKEEAQMERKYRRALAFREWNGELPPRDLTIADATLHEWDQCAEYISLPHVLKFARDYLGDTDQKKKKVVVYCLSMSEDRSLRLAFCENCQVYVRQIVNALRGLRIIDLASSPIAKRQITYQSNATVSLNDAFSLDVQILMPSKILFCARERCGTT